MQAAIVPTRWPAVPSVLFAEDFDAKPMLPAPAEMPPPEPEIIAPTFTLADLEAAQADGIAEGLAQAQREAETADRCAAQVAREQLSQALATAKFEAARIAEASAMALAELLVGTIKTALPTLCARHGPAEATAIAAALLPALAEEPHIAISLAPETISSVRDMMAGLEPAMQQRVTLTEDGTMPAGNITIRWRQGRAIRDTAVLLDAIDQALRACLPISSTHAENDDAG